MSGQDRQMAQVGVHVQRGGNGVLKDHNIATVWLLSSLGASHSASVKKKEIVKVSIPHACQVLASEHDELPLRHTGQLLYGVTVCYERKTGFILADVNSLKDALQRQWFGAKPLGKGTRDGVSASRRRGAVQSQTLAQTEDQFLQDDPNFNVMLQLNLDTNLDLDFLNGSSKADGSGKNQADKQAIRQEDMWNEMDLGIRAPGDAIQSRMYSDENTHGAGQANGDDDDDDLGSLDVDLNFRLDEVMTDNESESGNASSLHSDLNLDYNNENDLTHGIDLGMPALEENEISQSELEQVKRRFGLDENENQSIDADRPSKKQRKSPRNENVVQRIKIDTAIGLLTDTLRNNHDNYVETMEKLHAERHRNKEALPTWKVLLESEDQPICVIRNYVEIFQPLSSLNFPQARRGRSIHSTGGSSRSSSVLSLERGRKMDLSHLSNAFGGSDSNQYNLPNLPEQVNEYPEYAMDMQMNDSHFMELDIPPSSFGRSSNRNYTADSDNLDRLSAYAHRRRTGIRSGGSGSYVSDTESHSNSNAFPTYTTQQQMLIQDRQTSKFFHYIETQAEHVGRASATFPAFTRKFLFEDIIPSKLSQEEDEEVLPVTKRIACNAFLSLLQLATLGKVKIDLYDVAPEDKYRALNGDDIIVYC